MLTSDAPFTEDIAVQRIAICVDGNKGLFVCIEKRARDMVFDSEEKVKVAATDGGMSKSSAVHADREVAPPLLFSKLFLLAPVQPQ